MITIELDFPCADFVVVDTVNNRVIPVGVLECMDDGLVVVNQEISIDDDQYKLYQQLKLRG